MTLDFMRSTYSIMEVDHLNRFVWKDKSLKVLDGQNISTGFQRYMFTVRLLAGDAKATFNQATLDIGIRTVDNFK